MPGNGKIFISHAHEDNTVCAPVVAALTGWGVDYWFDMERMDAGQGLSQRIQKAIAEHDIFVRICTPAAKRSFWVEKETSAFLGLQAAEHAAGQGGKRVLINLILDAGYTLDPFDHATLFIDATSRSQHLWLAELRRALELDASVPGAGATVSVGGSGARPANAAEPPTRIVDPLYRGDHTTIAAAIAAAQPGDRILVRPGLYQEALVIEKPLEIVGQGPLGDVVIEAQGAHVVRFQTTFGRLTNLTIQQLGGGDWHGVEIAQGRLELDSCDITSQGAACVAIHDSASPVLRHNRIHDGQQGGVSICDSGRGTLEDNDIFANAYCGVEITTGSTPTLRRNRIQRNHGSGCRVAEEGRGTLEENEITANYIGLEIVSGGNPTARRNRIGEGQVGVSIAEEGRGILEENEITANQRAGVMVTTEGDPLLRRNRISGNGYQAIRIYEGGEGTYEENDLRGNTRGPWDIDASSEQGVKRARNQE